MEIKIDAPPVWYRASRGRRPSQSYYRDAARNLRMGYDVGGSNVREAIAKLLENAAEAMDAAMEAGATEPDAWPLRDPISGQCRRRQHHNCPGTNRQVDGTELDDCICECHQPESTDQPEQ